MIIYRGGMTTLWIKLQASEQLGLLSSDYLQDYFGNDGQVTLYHVESDTSFPLVMSEVVTESPTIPHDVFQGPIGIDTLPDGNFEVRGRVRDTADNYTILSAVQSPAGGEAIAVLAFEIKPGSSTVYRLSAGGLVLVMGLQAPVAIAKPAHQWTLKPPALNAKLNTGTPL